MRSIPFLVPLVVYLMAFGLMRPIPTGDEPSYALEARSLARDGDRDLRNQYDSPDDVRWASRNASTVPHAFTRGTSSELISVHGPGLPVLLAPAAAAFHSFGALRVVAILISALAALQLFRLLEQIGQLAERWRWAAWAATVFSLPWVSYANQLYPELAAVLVILVVLRCLIAATPWALVGGAAAAAVLPWLHVRFAAVAVMLAAALLVRALRSTRRRPLKARVASLTVAPSILSFGLLALAFQGWYGSASLTSPYQVAGFAATTRPALGLLYVNGLGGILSLGHGWLPYAPVALIAVAGAVYAGRGSGRWGAALGVGAAAYFLIVGLAHDLPSYNFPARLELPVVALSAIPLAISLTRLRVARLMFGPLALLSCAITFFGVTRPGMLYPHGDASGTREIPLVFTSIWPRLASRMPSTTRDLTGTDLARSTSLILPAADYRLAVRLRGPTRSGATRVTVRSGSELLGESDVPAASLPGDGTPRTFYVDVHKPRSGPVHVAAAGSGVHVLDGTMASLPNTLPGSDAPQRLDIVRTLGWVLTFLACWIAGLGVPVRRRPPVP